MTLLWVALGAAVGAPLRFVVDRWLNTGAGFPWGTFAVNVAGSLALGFLVGLQVSPTLTAALGVGFCGALTTYSTFGHEVLRESRSDRRITLAYALGSLAVGLVAAYLGMTAGRAL